MTERVTNLIAFVQVAEVERSIAFYEKFGFEVTGTYHHLGDLDFAAIESDRAPLMLVRAAGPIDARQQRILFYLYAPDLDALRDQLVADGLPVGPIVDGSPGPEREDASMAVKSRS